MKPLECLTATLLTTLSGAPLAHAQSASSPFLWNLPQRPALMVVGASVEAGWTSCHGGNSADQKVCPDAYVNKLRAHLAASYFGTSVTVHNRAAAGAKAADILQQARALGPHLQAHRESGVVMLVAVGGNDLLQGFQAFLNGGSFCGNVAALTAFLDDLESQLVRIAREMVRDAATQPFRNPSLAQFHPKTRLVLVNLYEPTDNPPGDCVNHQLAPFGPEVDLLLNGSETYYLCPINGFPYVVVRNLAANFRGWNQRIEDVAQGIRARYSNLEVEVVDAHGAFENYIPTYLNEGPSPNQAMLDCIHPNVSGHQALVDAVIADGGL